MEGKVEKDLSERYLPHCFVVQIYNLILTLIQGHNLFDKLRVLQVKRSVYKEYQSKYLINIQNSKSLQL